MISLKVFGVVFWLHWVEINKENRNFNFNVFLTLFVSLFVHFLKDKM